MAAISAFGLRLHFGRLGMLGRACLHVLYKGFGNKSEQTGPWGPTLEIMMHILSYP